MLMKFHVKALSSLRPFLDSNGLLWVGGRLENSELTQDQKHPIILHHSDRLSKLLARQAHVSNMHAGPQALFAILSLGYHIIGFKNLVKGISNQCVSCKKAYAKTNSQVMGQLPVNRVTLTSAFHHTSYWSRFCWPTDDEERIHTQSHTSESICLCICLYSD